MPLRPYYDRMIVERIPESLTWVRTNILPGSAKEGSRGGNVLAPVSATVVNDNVGACVQKETDCFPPQHAK